MVRPTPRINRLIADILAHEGGFSDNPDDAGGPTNFGITQQTLAAFRGEPVSVDSLKAMTIGEARDVYLTKYFHVPRFDDVAKLSFPVAEELTDTGVNMGIKAAGEFLQRALNVFNRTGGLYPDIAVDGAVGVDTLASLKAFLLVRKTDGETVLLKALNCLQGAGYIDLAEKRQADESFVYGWIKNRVEIAA